MKYRQIAINMLANIVAFIINIGISLFLTPYLVNSVGSEAYGFIPLANDFVSYISIITAALNSMASRFVSIEINSNNIKKANEYFNSVLISNIIIAIVLIIPSVFIILYIDKLLNVPNEILSDVKLTFGCVFFNMIISLIGNVFSIATFAKNRLDLSSIRAIKGNIIRVIVIITLFILFKPKIYFITITLTIVTLYTIITNIYYTKKLLPEITFNLKDFNKHVVIKLIKSGIWNSINQLSSVLLNSLDLIIANIFISSIASGQYSIVKTIPNFIQSFAGMAAGVFTPQFVILYAKNKHKELLNNILESTKIMGLFITIPIGFLIVFGDIFYSLWVPGENTQKLQLLSLITIIPMIITGSVQTLFNVYTVANKLKVPSIMLLIFGIFKMLIVIVLLKTTNMGIFSIAITSSLLSMLRNLIFTPIYAAKCLNVKYSTFYISILKGIGCSIVMISTCLIYKNIFITNSWVTLILAGLICSIISLYINLFIMFDKSERINIRQRVISIIKIKCRGVKNKNEKTEGKISL